MTFTQGNAFKYLWRAGRKDPNKYKEDLEKAKWYIKDAQYHSEVWHNAKSDNEADQDSLEAFLATSPYYHLMLQILDGDRFFAYCTAEALS